MLTFRENDFFKFTFVSKNILWWINELNKLANKTLY